MRDRVDRAVFVRERLCSAEVRCSENVEKPPGDERLAHRVLSCLVVVILFMNCLVVVFNIHELSRGRDHDDELPRGRVHVRELARGQEWCQ